MALMDGVSLARTIIANNIGQDNAKKMEAVVSEKFSRAFPEGKPIPKRAKYHEKAYEIMAGTADELKKDAGIENVCKEKKLYGMEFGKQGYLEPMIVNILNVLACQRLVDMPYDDSGPQNPAVFSAGPSSVSPRVAFGSGFGLCMNSTTKQNVREFDDNVPFSYGHNHLKNPPAMEIFWEAHFPNGKKDTTFQNQARLVYNRRKQYVEKIRESVHYAGDSCLDAKVFGEGYKNVRYYNYHHIGEDKTTGARTKIEVPILTAIYNGEDGTFKAVFKDRQTQEILQMRLVDFLEKSGLSQNDERFKKIIKTINELEKNIAYPRLAEQGHSIKEWGCVDDRVFKGFWNVGWHIKEIGSRPKEEQITRHAQSILSDGTAIGTHRMCGYNTELKKIHMAFSEIGKVIGDKNPYLKKIISASLKRIVGGRKGVLFEEKRLDYAFEEMEKDRMHLSKPTKKLLKELISEESNDVRETVYHAYDRGAAKANEKGLIYVPVVAKAEEIATAHLNPAEQLHEDHFDFITNELFALELVEKFKNSINGSGQGGNEYPLTGFVVDLMTGWKVKPRETEYRNREDLLGGVERELYYKPGDVRRLDVKLETHY